jgi:hypothetical protein
MYLSIYRVSTCLAFDILLGNKATCSAASASLGSESGTEGKIYFVVNQQLKNEAVLRTSKGWTGSGFHVSKEIIANIR